MYFRNNNYWALILGGSSGIGLATAKKLAGEGLNLCIVHRDRKKETRVFQEIVTGLKEDYGIKTLTFNINALQTEQQERVIQVLKQELVEQGKIHLLLHSISRGNLKLLAPSVPSEPDFKQVAIGQELNRAYATIHSDLLDQYRDQSLLTTEDLIATLNAMAISLHDWVNLLFQNGLFSAKARVIGLTSEGSKKVWRNYAAVSIAKVALESLCRSIALEYAPHGIRCNIVQPGVTDTPSLRMIPGSEHLKANALSRNPMQRLTQPEDVANVISLLCRKEADWINGAIIPVDGGESIA